MMFNPGDKVVVFQYDGEEIHGVVVLPPEKFLPQRDGYGATTARVEFGAD